MPALSACFPSPHSPRPFSPFVTVGGSLGTTYSVAVGQTITVPVFATVNNASSTQGIGTYDFDALVTNSGLQVISYTLDGNPALGNQTFTTIDNSSAAGSGATTSTLALMGMAWASTPQPRFLP